MRSGVEVLVHRARRSAQQDGHNVDVDRRVRHTVQDELLVDDVLVVLHEQLLGDRVEVLHALRHVRGGRLEFRRHKFAQVRSGGQADGSQHTLGALVEDVAQVGDRMLQGLLQLLQMGAGLLQAGQCDEQS